MLEWSMVCDRAVLGFVWCLYEAEDELGVTYPWFGEAQDGRHGGCKGDYAAVVSLLRYERFDGDGGSGVCLGEDVSRADVRA